MKWTGTDQWFKIRDGKIKKIRIMNKIKLIYSFIVLISLSISLLSCNDDTKEDNLSATMVYFVHDGVQNLKMYDKGNNTIYAYSLDLYKSGAIENSSSVRVGIMSADELVAYNTANGTNFELLAPDVYNLEKNEVSFSSDRKDVNQTIIINFDPSKLAPDNTNKVLPLKIVSASVDINKEKSICIIYPQSHTPNFSLTTLGSNTISYTKGEQSVPELDIVTQLDIDENDSDIELEIEIDRNYVTQYNLDNEEDYTVPEANKYTLETKKTLKAGKTELAFNLKIFQQYLTGNYMLPIRLKSSSKFGVNKDEYYVVKLNVLADELSKKDWTIADFSSEEATGESGGANGKAIYLIDGNKNTFWHSQWQGAMATLPHYITIDMKKSMTITQIDMYQRQTSIAEVQTKAGQFLISEDNINWKKLANFEAPKTHNLLSYPVKKAKGRYLKVLITESYFNNQVASIGEITARGY